MSAKGRSYDVAVIGAGHNGLVAAALLARAGLSVVVLEQREEVGGMAGTREFHPGFRVDTGAHRLGAFDRRVWNDLRLEKIGVELVRPDPMLVGLLPEGAPIVLRRDLRESVRELERRSVADAARWPAFVARCRRAQALLAALATREPPELPPRRLGDWVALAGAGLRLRRLGRREMAEVLRLLPMPVADLLEEWFETEALKGLIAAGALGGLRYGPRAMGTVLALLGQPGAGVEDAAVLVRGGVGRLAAGLADAARRSGAEIRTGRRVERVLVRHGVVEGVVLVGGEVVAATRVVSAVAPAVTLLRLLDPAGLDPGLVRAARRIRHAGVAAKVHLALDGLPAPPGGDGRAWGSVVRVAPSLEYLERAADAAKYGEISAAPYLEMVFPSVTDAVLAPRGKHVASVLVQWVGSNPAASSADRRAYVGQVVLSALREFLPGLGERMLGLEVVLPEDFAERYGAPGGDAYHGEPVLDQWWFARPAAGGAQYRGPVRGLYLCSVGMHPGGGVSGVPGCNAARVVLRDVRRGAPADLAWVPME